MSEAKASSVSSTTYRARVKASQIVRVASKGERFKIKNAMDSVEEIADATLIIGHDGKIVDVGPTSEMESKYASATFENTWDYTGCSIIPGFVDAVRFFFLLHA